jgi:hypothetical protein
MAKLSNIHTREFKNKFEFISATEHLKFRTFKNLTYLWGVDDTINKGMSLK